LGNRAAVPVIALIACAGLAEQGNIGIHVKRHSPWFGAIGDALHYEFSQFLKPGLTENQVTALA
jgi:hypothetical protein